MGYGTVVMMQHIEPKDFDRSAPAPTYTINDEQADSSASI
jgi:hypothetical protein